MTVFKRFPLHLLPSSPNGRGREDYKGGGPAITIEIGSE